MQDPVAHSGKSDALKCSQASDTQTGGIYDCTAGAAGGGRAWKCTV